MPEPADAGPAAGVAIGLRAFSWALSPPCSLPKACGGRDGERRREFLRDGECHRRRRSRARGRRGGRIRRAAADRLSPTCGSGSRRRASSARSARSRGSPGNTTSAWPPRSSCTTRTRRASSSRIFRARSPGSRVLVNFFGGQRQNMTLGFPTASRRSSNSARRFASTTWPTSKRIPPQYVNDGPIFENVITGDDVDVTMFPTPKWHRRRRRPLYRHRQLQRDPRSGRGLDQLRHLPRDDP